MNLPGELLAGSYGGQEKLDNPLQQARRKFEGEGRMRWPTQKNLPAGCESERHISLGGSRSTEQNRTVRMSEVVSQ
jgi:hypothetical protein